MHKQRHLVSVFFFFLLLSMIFAGLSLSSFGMRTRGLLEVIVSPIRNSTLFIFAGSKKVSLVQQLQDENLQLRSQLVLFQNEEREIRALRDQFAITSIDPQSLLPAKIVGRRSILPGSSVPDQIVLDKGSSDGVLSGSTIVYKDIFLGQIASVSDQLSIVDLSYRKDFSITATMADSGALGIVKGTGMGEMVLDNVVLSDKLNIGSNVITKGSIDKDGKGILPGLFIGKIVSVDKKPSALFQTAKVALNFDINRSDVVFILMQVR